MIQQKDLKIQELNACLEASKQYINEKEKSLSDKIQDLTDENEKLIALHAKEIEILTTQHSD